MVFLTSASTTNMSALLSACLLALQGLPLPEAAAGSSSHAGTWLAAAAPCAGTHAVQTQRYEAAYSDSRLGADVYNLAG